MLEVFVSLEFSDHTASKTKLAVRPGQKKARIVSGIHQQALDEATDC